MKYYLAFLLSFAFSVCNAQDTLYQFPSYTYAPADSFDSYYFRVITKNSGLWHVKDYYITKGTLAMEGYFQDDSLKIPTGMLDEYYLNAKRKAKRNYINGKKEGESRKFHKNGKPAELTYYLNDLPIGVSYKWNDEGNLIFKGEYDTKGKGTGTETTFHWNGSMDTYGVRSEGYLRDSIWTYFFKSGATSYREYYKQGTLLNKECYDENGRESRCDSLLMPEFKGDINTFLNRKLKYPPGYVGLDLPRLRVVAKFTVDASGEITDIKIMQKSIFDFNYAVIRAINKMPKWKPGKDHNRPVSVEYTLPVVFKSK